MNSVRTNALPTHSHAHPLRIIIRKSSSAIIIRQQWMAGWLIIIRPRRRAGLEFLRLATSSVGKKWQCWSHHHHWQCHTINMALKLYSSEGSECRTLYGTSSWPWSKLLRVAAPTKPLLNGTATELTKLLLDFHWTDNTKRLHARTGTVAQHW